MNKMEERLEKKFSVLGCKSLPLFHVRNTAEWIETYEDIFPDGEMEEREVIAGILLFNGYLSVGHTFSSISTGEAICALSLNIFGIFGNMDSWLPINESELKPILKAVIVDKDWGALKYACVKMNMKPTDLNIERMKSSGSWDDIMESLPNNDPTIRVNHKYGGFGYERLR